MVARTETFALGKAPHVGAVRTEEGFENLSVPFDELRKVLSKHRVREKKDGVYITRPMSGGDHSRSDANAGDWKLVPLDIDELQPEELPALRKWFEDSKFRGFISTTFSHRADRPKVRIMLVASRETTASEHSYIYRALESMVPFKLDDCMAKPSQPIFLPSCPAEHEGEAFAEYRDGEPLDIDRLLAAFKKEMEEAAERRASNAEDAHQVGVRQPGGLIEWFNANFDLPSLLVECGYKRKSINRYIAPQSRSGRAAVVVYEGRTVISFHDPAHDPLAVRNKQHQAVVLDAFAAYCKLKHGDDFKKAFAGALAISRSAGWEGEAAIPKEDRIASAPAFLLNAEELYGSLVAQDMLIDGMLDSNTVTIASGDSNSGKTTVLQYVSLQISMGAPVATRKTRQGTVLWVAGEDIDNAKYRMVAMCEEYAIDATALGDSFLLLPQPIAILDADSMISLHESIRTRIGTSQQLALVVVDSKSVNWGGKDENSNDENAQFVAAVRKFLITPFGRPAVIITHHLTKHREKEAQTSRGGGALINNADHEWRFEMNQDAKICSMFPGSKVRMERWPETRFAIKTVSLPEAKLPQLVNNFGEMPKVSIADPVNQYARSMKQLKLDTDLRAIIAALKALLDSKQDAGTTSIARAVGWLDGANDPDYRKAKRLLDIAVKQKLLEKKDKAYVPTDAGVAFIKEEVLVADPERTPGEDDQ